MNTTSNSFSTRFMARFKHGYSTRAAYMAALKSALAGLAPDAADAAMADHERRFAEGAASGQSERDVAAGMADPRKTAAELKASTDKAAFSRKKTVPNLWRLFISLIGLCIFNLFMVIPAIVFASLLVAFNCVAVAFFIAGIAVTASGISGVNQISFHDDDKQVIVARSVAPATVTIDIEGVDVHPEASGNGLSISGDIADYSRGEQTAGGIGLIAGSILMLLLGLLVTKYTLIGIKRYVVMNYSLLRNA